MKKNESIFFFGNPCGQGCTSELLGVESIFVTYRPVYYLTFLKNELLTKKYTNKYFRDFYFFFTFSQPWSLPGNPSMKAILSWPTSILVCSPPFTIGTVLPAWMRYGPIEWPFRLRIGFTTYLKKLRKRLKKSIRSKQKNAGVKGNTLNLITTPTFFRPAQLRRTTWPLQWTPRCHTDERQCRPSESVNMNNVKWQ